MPDKTIPIGATYWEIVDKFPELFPKKREKGVLRDKDVYDADLIWRRAKAITEYIATNTCIVFMINKLNSEVGENSTFTAAYASLGYNGVVMFGNDIRERENTLPHELGHSLGLNHSFHASMPMFHQKVRFNTSDWDKKIIFKHEK